MMLHDVLKSGGKFRRTGNLPDVWYVNMLEFDGEQSDYLLSVDGEKYGLMKEDILANDWELMPVVVPITAQQFWEAFSQAQKDFMKEPGFLVQYPTGTHWDIVPRMAAILGLKKD